MNTQQEQDMGHEQLLDDFVARSRFRSEVYQEVLKYAALETLRRPPPVPPAPPPPRVKRIGEVCWLATQKAGRWLIRQISYELDEPSLTDDSRDGQPIIIVCSPEAEGDDFSQFIFRDPFMIDEEE